MAQQSSPTGRAWLWRAGLSATLFLVVVPWFWYSPRLMPKAPRLVTLSVPDPRSSADGPDDAAGPSANKLLAQDSGTTPSGMVLIPGGVAVMGNDLAGDDESPSHEIEIASFWLDEHEVTIRQFAEFVNATGHQTTAEQVGRAFVFDAAEKKWVDTPKASWRRPTGKTAADLQSDLPVTQVSWVDATAYARWAGKRLPTEAEWEYAARGGLSDANYPWGRELRPEGHYEANHWQGWFPDKDLGADGFLGVSPVKSFRASPYGLYDISGNVWEWCSDRYAPDYYLVSPRENPPGPTRGHTRVIRGGSFLCSENASRGLFVFGRDNRPPATCYQHIGFRCARNKNPADVAISH